MNYGFIRQLAQFFNVDVINQVAPEYQYENDKYYQKTESSVKFHFIAVVRSSLIRILYSVVMFGSTKVVNNPQYKKQIQTCLSQKSYEYVFIDLRVWGHCRKMILSRKYGKPVIVLITENYEVKNVNDYVSMLSSSVIKIKTWLQHWGLPRYERSALRDADLVISVSELDAGWFHERYGIDNEKIIQLPLYFPYKQIKNNYQVHTDTLNLLFLGSMSWFPNVDGILWFISEVFRPLSRLDARYKLFIVGSNPHKSLLNIRDENIHITGSIPSVDEYIRESDLMIVPNRLGAGVKVKIYESIMKGLPVILHEASTAGYPDDLFPQEFIASSAEEMQAAITSIMFDENKKKEFIESAQKILGRRCDHFVQSVLPDL